MAESKVVFTLIKLEVHSVGFHVSDFMCRMLEIHSIGFHVSDVGNSFSWISCVGWKIPVDVCCCDYEKTHQNLSRGVPLTRRYEVFALNTIQSALPLCWGVYKFSIPMQRLGLHRSTTPPTLKVLINQAGS